MRRLFVIPRRSKSSRPENYKEPAIIFICDRIYLRYRKFYAATASCAFSRDAGHIYMDIYKVEESNKNL